MTRSGSTLEAALALETPGQALGAVFFLALEESVAEVRVAWEPVGLDSRR